MENFAEMVPIEIENPEEFFDRRDIPHNEKNTIISSNNVSHFTKKFSTLLKILENGFRPSFCNESPIYRKEYEELEALTRLLEIELPNINDVEIPMVCFCDFPIKHSYKHRKLYGMYGIGLTKRWAISNWITPVTYVAENTKNHSTLYSIYSQIERAKNFHRDDQCNNPDNPHLIIMESSFYRFLDYVKPYYNLKENRKYYDEREWRYIPDHFTQEDLENPERYFKYQFKDLYQITVTSADERRQVIKLLRNKFSMGSKKIIKIRHK